MSIETRNVVRYYAVCDDCARGFGPQPRLSMAEADLSSHKCGEHRREHDSTGGFRGILGGWRRSCVCGASWVVESSSEPFKCPKDSSTQADEPRDSRS